jgi:hypothetical protein
MVVRSGIRVAWLAMAPEKFLDRTVLPLDGSVYRLLMG